MSPNNSVESFPDYFAKLWKEIESTLIDWVKKEKLNSGKVLFKDALDIAIRLWCQKLNVSEVEISHINIFQQSNTNKLDNFWSVLKDLKMTNFKINNQTDLIVLIAFVVTIVGCAFYFISQQQNREERQSRINQSVPTLPSLGEEKDTWFLLLVINAGKNEIIQSLENGRVTTIDPDALYCATQALWMGSKADFSQSELNNWFLNKRTVSKSKSEYDVYFVQIELRKYDSGFDPNANQISRIDAFHRLPNNLIKVRVSDRLPSKAYENRFLYSR